MRYLVLINICLLLALPVNAGMFSKKAGNPDQYPSIGFYSIKTKGTGDIDYPMAQVFKRPIKVKSHMTLIDILLPLNNHFTLNLAHGYFSTSENIADIGGYISNSKTSLFGSYTKMGIKIYLKN